MHAVAGFVAPGRAMANRPGQGRGTRAPSVTAGRRKASRAKLVHRLETRLSRNTGLCRHRRSRSNRRHTPRPATYCRVDASASSRASSRCGTAGTPFLRPEGRPLLGQYCRNFGQTQAGLWCNWVDCSEDGPGWSVLSRQGYGPARLPTPVPPFPVPPERSRGTSSSEARTCQAPCARFCRWPAGEGASVSQEERRGVEPVAFVAA